MTVSPLIRAMTVLPLVVLAALSGCSEPVARRAADVARPTPTPLPDNFCGLATAALPDGWNLKNVESDPYDNEALGISATCTLDTGYDGDTHTAMIVNWNPAKDAEESAASLSEECDRVSRIAAGSGVTVEQDDTTCQGIDNSENPQWTLLAATHATNHGVLFVRVDDTNPKHSKTLAIDTRQFATDLLTSIAQ